MSINALSNIFNRHQDDDDDDDFYDSESSSDYRENFMPPFIDHSYRYNLSYLFIILLYS